jgi:hypothetical protein
MQFVAEKLTSRSKTFVEQCLGGDALVEDIDDFVDRWHDGHDDRSLREAIGLSTDEYDLWVQEASALRIILFARSQELSIEDALKASAPDAIAARAASLEEGKKIYAWLRRTGRIK